MGIINKETQLVKQDRHLEELEVHSQNDTPRDKDYCALQIQTSTSMNQHYIANGVSPFHILQLL